MPGFNISGTGGDSGEGAPTNVVETRRKHRWRFTTLEPVASILLVLQKANRPNFVFEEPEMHHNEEKAYFAGKRSWEPVTMTWYDTVENQDATKKLYSWLDEKTGSIKQANTKKPSDYKKEAKLEMLLGDGTKIETWIMHGCWPKSINWGDLDYTSTDIQLIECNMRYDRATME